MKFTLSWLKDHLETDAGLAQITEQLTMLGLEVEEVIDPADKLKDFRVAKIIEAGPHPDADKLKLCKVEALIDGKVEHMQVVCGAPNAKAGLLGIFAPSGATIPANGMVLKPTKIRGVQSNGMMCSQAELELSDEHTGIIELTGEFEVGTPAAEVLGQNDPMIEIGITPNRPDCLGVRGIARDLAAAGLGRLKEDPLSPPAANFDSPVKVRLEFDTANETVCPHFSGRIVRGVKNGPSPAWLQNRLKAIGLRPINALVDITNYISYDRARPLHVYDVAKLNGDICARLGKGETFLALDGNEYTADSTMCVIADDSQVLGLGGVMGGEASGSTDATTDVFIESAYFDPSRTAATGRKTGILSDARYRFERGVDPDGTAPGCDLAAQMITDICGGEVSRLVEAGKAPDTSKSLDFDPTQVARLTGVKVGAEEVSRILKELGFTVETGAPLKITSPSWRPDIGGRADLVEEVIRVYGLGKVASVPLPRDVAVTEPILTVSQKRVRTAKRAAAARGLVEAVTWSFIPQADAALFGGADAAGALALANPISSEMSHMRPSLLAGLVAATGRNIDRGFADIALFEVGQCFAGDQPQDQHLVAAGLRRGAARHEGSGRHWQGKAPPVDLYEAKADAMDLLSELGVDTAKLQISTDVPAWYHPGRAGVANLGPKNTLAIFGELHPRVLSEMDVAGPLVAFEVYLDAIPAAKKKPTKAKPALNLSDLQPVRRDFAFVVAKTVNADTLLRAAKGADKKLITDVNLFDLFEGGNLAADQKSLAIEVTLQPADKTLTDPEIEAVSAKLIDAVVKATGATLRG